MTTKRFGTHWLAPECSSWVWMHSPQSVEQTRAWQRLSLSGRESRHVAISVFGRQVRTTVSLKKHSSEFGFAHSRYQKLRKGCTSKQDGATSGLYAGNSMLDGLLSLVPQIESHFRLEYMVKKDIYYIIEQPDSSILWDHPAMKVVASSPIRGTWVVAGFCF